MALAATCQEALWLRALSGELIPQSKTIVRPTTIFCDNKEALDLTSQVGYHLRTKHIDTRHHFIRERIEINEINVIYKDSNNMLQMR